MDISTRIKRARQAAGLTQHDVARLTGIHQSTIAAYETGRRHPNEDTCRVLLTSIGIRARDLLDLQRDEVRSALAERGIDDARVFGSVARGEDDEGSDVDIMFTPPPDADFVVMAELDELLERIIGTDVDVISVRSLNPDRNPVHRKILGDAIPV